MTEGGIKGNYIKNAQKVSLKSIDSYRKNSLPVLLSITGCFFFL